MTTKLGGSVGHKCMNAADDVKIVQSLLGRHLRWLVPFRLPEPTGTCDAETQRAIAIFQERAAALSKPDSVVSPSGYTFKALNRAIIAGPQHPIFDPRKWTHDPDPLSAADFKAAATELGCEAAAIEAVARTETKTSPWDKEGRPTILFERHYFSRLSGGAYDRSHSDISNPAQGGYGKFSAQYPKLTRAATLDEQAALKSASWGSFQIMGANHVAAGFTTVDDFVSAMMRSERAHLDAFVSFIKADKVLLKALRDKDWAKFAKRYNGPGYKKNDYDTKMANEYKKLAPPPPVPKAPGATKPPTVKAPGSG